MIGKPNMLCLGSKGPKQDIQKKSLMIPKGLSESVNRLRTENTTIGKTLHIKLKIR